MTDYCFDVFISPRINSDNAFTATGYQVRIAMIGLLKPWHLIVFAVVGFLVFFWMGREKHH
jgi:hypothetical protein